MWAQPKEPREKFETLRRVLTERYPGREIDTKEVLTTPGFTMSRESYEINIKRGPFGRIGPGTDFSIPLPSSEYFICITVKAKMEKIEKLKYIQIGMVGEDTDGLWNSITKIMIKSQKNITHRQVIKKPGFYALYIAMLKINPDYTEEELIGEETIVGEYYDTTTFNKNAVEDIVYSTTTIEATYDPVFANYNIYVMYDDIDKHLDYITKDIDSLML